MWPVLFNLLEVKNKLTSWWNTQTYCYMEMKEKQRMLIWIFHKYVMSINSFWLILKSSLHSHWNSKFSSHSKYQHILNFIIIQLKGGENFVWLKKNNKIYIILSGFIFLVNSFPVYKFLSTFKYNCLFVPATFLVLLTVICPHNLPFHGIPKIIYYVMCNTVSIPTVFAFFFFSYSSFWCTGCLGNCLDTIFRHFHCEYSMNSESVYSTY